MKSDFEDFANSKIRDTINEWVHSARDREIMQRRLIDGETYREIADSMMLTPRTVKAIASKLEGRIFRHLG